MLSWQTNQAMKVHTCLATLNIHYLPFIPLHLSSSSHGNIWAMMIVWSIRGNCSVLCCVWQLYTMIRTHTYEQFLKLSVRSFVRYCGQGSSLWTPAWRLSRGPLHLPRREEGNWLVCAWLAGCGELSRHEQLVGYLLDAPPQGVAYCLARPGWNFFSNGPLALLQC